MKWYKLLLSFAFMCLAVFVCFVTPYFKAPQNAVKDGRMVITQADFYGGSCVPLNGKWAFYWQKLLDGDQVKAQKPDLYAYVPGEWNSLAINGRQLPAQGYATYSLHVKTDVKKGEIMGLCLNTFSSAYRVIVDGRVVASNGTVGRSAADSVGEYRPLEASFAVPSNGFDIIVQVSNYQFGSGGFWYGAYLGSEQAANGLYERRNISETLILGILVFIFLSCLSTFIGISKLRHDGRLITFMPLILTLAVLIDLNGQFFILKLIPLNYHLTIIFTYLTLLWTVTLEAVFTWQIFRFGWAKWPVRAATAVSCVISLFCVFTPTVLYDTLLTYGFYFIDAEFLFSFSLPLYGMIKGKKNAALYFNCQSVFVICCVYGMLNNNNLIGSGIISVRLLGVCVLVFMQCYVQARLVADTYAANIKLLNSRIKLLDELNRYAEREKVTELKFLQSQIRPHFIYNALNTISCVLLYDTAYARRLLVDFSSYLRGSFDFKNFDGEITLERELEHVRSYLSLEQARFGEKLRVIYDIRTEKSSNYKIPALVLQPLVENAIIHGIRQKPEGGTVTVSAREEDGCLVLCVGDDGVGIPLDTLRQLKANNSEHGVGLRNISLRLKKLYDCPLSIQSEEGKGTLITVRLPLNDNTNSN